MIKNPQTHTALWTAKPFTAMKTCLQLLDVATRRGAGAGGGGGGDFPAAPPSNGLSPTFLSQKNPPQPADLLEACVMGGTLSKTIP